MPIHALWCHPRSVSTAFERIMRERGDLDVLHEPFMYDYYLNRSNRTFADFDPDPEHPSEYGAIRAMIVQRAERGPVFFKDMAYYVVDLLHDDPGFMRAMTHAFLIRDPAESILSYHRRDPGFTCEEVGIEAQWHLYNALRSIGIDAPVIRSSALRAAPERVMARYWDHAGLAKMPEALHWDASVPDDWVSVKDWHLETLQSGTIRPPETQTDHHAKLAALGAPWTEYDAHHRPYFEALCAVADEQMRSD